MAGQPGITGPYRYGHNSPLPPPEDKVQEIKDELSETRPEGLSPVMTEKKQSIANLPNSK